MKNIIWIVLFGVLVSCGQLSPANVQLTGQTMTARVKGHEIRVEFYARGAEGYSGFAVQSFGVCAVYINSFYIPTPSLGHVMAHEIAHCLDHLELGWDHNGFSDEGKRFGEYYSSPEEGFAESFARAYTEACGQTHAPLLTDGACIPDPRAIKP
jgi:hypothetical protein